MVTQDIVIKARNLSKQYQIGSISPGYRTLRESLLDTFTSSYRRVRNLTPHESDRNSIWALKDVSFDVRRGEVLGIIGRNGAGKSTLLKILSRITKPTGGQANIRGRIGSLLEVGTGFHPELTGRENIYLNGAIMGMNHVEIERKFDDIVQFAEIEQFLETPVKHYSSGMYVRLAFSVAAHLEPEILLIDEVLAVGDMAFQRKCLGKMGDVVQQGRTVIFVSHQLAMVNTLCNRAILLDCGKLVDQGVTSQIVEKYLKSFVEDGNARTHVVYPKDQTKKAQLLQARVIGVDGEETTQFDVFDQITVCVTFEIRDPLDGISVNLVVKRNGELLFVTFETDDQPNLLNTRSKGVYSTTVDLPSPLKSGKYSLDIYIGKINVGGIDEQLNSLMFQVDDKSFDTSVRSYSSKRPGVMAAHLPWCTKPVD